MTADGAPRDTAGDPPTGRDTRFGVLGVLIGASATQSGAAFGTRVLPEIGPLGLAGVRQLTAAVALLVVVRPRIRGFTRRQWGPAVVLGLMLVLMNTAFYASLQRLDLGLAVTIEFVGPLALAIAGSKRVTDVAAGLLALAGIAALTGVGGATAAPDPLGVGFVLVAAAAWAGYIVFSHRVGRVLPGVTGTALGSTVAAIVTLPAVVVTVVRLPADRVWPVLGVGVLTGVLSSAVPYSIDMLVLRRVPRALFGMLQSLQPVAAAGFGLLIAGQVLDAVQIGGIAAVCVANCIVLWPGRRAKGAVVPGR